MKAIVPNYLKFIFYFRKLADEELMLNVKSHEKFTLPSGQEIERENILFLFFSFM